MTLPYVSGALHTNAPTDSQSPSPRHDGAVQTRGYFQRNVVDQRQAGPGHRYVPLFICSHDHIQTNTGSPHPPVNNTIGVVSTAIGYPISFFFFLPDKNTVDSHLKRSKYHEIHIWIIILMVF